MNRLKFFLLLFILLTSLKAQEVDSVFNMYKVKIITNEIPDTLMINGISYKIHTNNQIISVKESSSYKIIAVKDGYYTDKINLSALKKQHINLLNLEFSNKKPIFNVFSNLFGESFKKGQFEVVFSTGFTHAPKQITFYYNGETIISPLLYNYRYELTFEPSPLFIIQAGMSFNRFNLCFSYSKSEIKFSEIDFKESVLAPSGLFHTAIGMENTPLNVYQFNASWMVTRVADVGIGFIVGYHWATPIIIEKEIEITQSDYSRVRITNHSQSIKLTLENSGFLPGLYVTWRPIRYLSLDMRAQYTSGYKIDNVSKSVQQGQMLFSFLLNGHF